MLRNLFWQSIHNIKQKEKIYNRIASDGKNTNHKDLLLEEQKLSSEQMKDTSNKLE